MAGEFSTFKGSKIARIAPTLTNLGRNRSRRSVLVFQKFSRHQNYRVDEKNRQTDPDRDQCETDPRPRTGPDRTGFRYRPDGPDEHRFLWRNFSHSLSLSQHNGCKFKYDFLNDVISQKPGEFRNGSSANIATGRI